MHCSDHAMYRQAQRNLSDRDVQFVLDYGRTFYCAGAKHVFLGRRDIPRDPDVRRQYARLEGTTLVVSENDGVTVLITAYRNRRGQKHIRSKK
ncbi:MAG: DUF4258 domain-containing protein, partial [Chloroflexaceae bacterium]|nr:DUF4258 domain-containing protein [Chloroflexaceae bacterium]